MIISFTGTRKGMTEQQKVAVNLILFNTRPEYVVHGDCIGADADFDWIAAGFGFAREIYPSNVPEKRAYCEAQRQGVPRPPLERNKIIVNQCDLLIACPKEEREILRSGTWATIRYARKLQKRIIIIYPDGTSNQEWNGA